MARAAGADRPLARAAGADRPAVTREGPGKPIMLTLYGPDGEAVAVALLPKRALTLAQELLMKGVSAIKADQADPGSSLSYAPPTPPQGPVLSAQEPSRARALLG